MSDLTWTEIAIQLTGEVPVSCKMTTSGGLVVTLAGGKTCIYTAKQVDDAIGDLDEIARPEGNPIPTLTPNPLSARTSSSQGGGEKNTAAKSQSKPNPSTSKKPATTASKRISSSTSKKSPKSTKA